MVIRMGWACIRDGMGVHQVTNFAMPDFVFLPICNVERRSSKVTALILWHPQHSGLKWCAESSGLQLTIIPSCSEGQWASKLAAQAETARLAAEAEFA